MSKDKTTKLILLDSLLQETIENEFIIRAGGSNPAKQML